jgi:hypothetical protein
MVGGGGAIRLRRVRERDPSHIELWSPGRRRPAINGSSGEYALILALGFGPDSWRIFAGFRVFCGFLFVIPHTP